MERRKSSSGVVDLGVDLAGAAGVAVVEAGEDAGVAGDGKKAKAETTAANEILLSQCHPRTRSTRRLKVLFQIEVASV